MRCHLKRCVTLIIALGTLSSFLLLFSDSFNLNYYAAFPVDMHIAHADEIRAQLNLGHCHTEQRRFVFIKCMKCATETIATIFRRFGFSRDLNFALPLKRNLYFGWPFPIEKADVRPSKFPYDILMEHSIYNNTVMESLMPEDAVYISIIRSPWNQFKSMFNYFDIGRIAHIPNKNFTEYVLNLKYYDTIYSSPENNLARWCIPDGFSMSKNLMSHCLGMPLGFPPGRSDISNYTDSIQQYIHLLDKKFKLIMVADYLDESLILLKRMLCWSFKDIIYRRVNVGSYSYKTYKPEGQLYEIYKNWSKADFMLFDHFNNSFWSKVGQEGADFSQEVAQFRVTQILIDRFCFVENNWSKPSEYITVPESKFSPGFNYTGRDCDMMNYILPRLWDRYFEREGIEKEPFIDPKDRPKPAKGCSI